MTIFVPKITNNPLMRVKPLLPKPIFQFISTMKCKKKYVAYVISNVM